MLAFHRPDDTRIFPEMPRFGITPRVAVAVVVLLIAGFAVAWLAWAGQPPSAESSARTACETMDEFEKHVRENSRVSVIRADLNRAKKASGQAVARSSRWVALDGGVRAVEIGILNDDAAATSSGIRVVRAECAKLPG